LNDIAVLLKCGIAIIKWYCGNNAVSRYIVLQYLDDMTVTLHCDISHCNIYCNIAE